MRNLSEEREEAMWRSGERGQQVQRPWGQAGLVGQGSRKGPTVVETKGEKDPHQASSSSETLSILGDISVSGAECNLGQA